MGTIILIVISVVLWSLCMWLWLKNESLQDLNMELTYDNEDLIDIIKYQDEKLDCQFEITSMHKEHITNLNEWIKLLTHRLVVKQNKIKELEEKSKPQKPIKLEIIDLDEIIMPKYTNTIDKYMCDNCGLTWFIVDEHTYQHKYCKQCGQALNYELEKE